MNLNALRTAAEVLAALDREDTWIERTKSRGAFLVRRRGEETSRTRVAKRAMYELEEGRLIKHHEAERYFRNKEVFDLSELGINRLRGIRPFKIVARG